MDGPHFVAAADRLAENTNPEYHTSERPNGWSSSYILFLYKILFIYILIDAGFWFTNFFFQWIVLHQIHFLQKWINICIWQLGVEGRALYWVPRIGSLTDIFHIASTRDKFGHMMTPRLEGTGTLAERLHGKARSCSGSWSTESREPSWL